MRRIHPLVSARIATALHPLGAGVLLLLGAAGAPLFVILYGAGNGLLTIARGTVPLAVFGPHGYGRRTGLLGAPARAAQALAPLGFGFLLDRMGIVRHPGLGRPLRGGAGRAPVPARRPGRVTCAPHSSIRQARARAVGSRIGKH